MLIKDYRYGEMNDFNTSKFVMYYFRNCITKGSFSCGKGGKISSASPFTSFFVGLIVQNIGSYLSQFLYASG